MPFKDVVEVGVRGSHRPAGRRERDHPRNDLLIGENLRLRELRQRAPITEVGTGQLRHAHGAIGGNTDHDLVGHGLRGLDHLFDHAIAGFHREVLARLIKPESALGARRGRRRGRFEIPQIGEGKSRGPRITRGDIAYGGDIPRATPAFARRYP